MLNQFCDQRTLSDLDSVRLFGNTPISLIFEENVGRASMGNRLLKQWAVWFCPPYTTYLVRTLRAWFRPPHTTYLVRILRAWFCLPSTTCFVSSSVQYVLGFVCRTLCIWSVHYVLGFVRRTLCIWSVHHVLGFVRRIHRFYDYKVPVLQ